MKRREELEFEILNEYVAEIITLIENNPKLTNEKALERVLQKRGVSAFASRSDILAHVILLIGYANEELPINTFQSEMTPKTIKGSK